MNATRRKRLFFILFLLVGLGLALGIILSALQQNIDLYYTPTQLQAAKHQPDSHFRLGGMVEKKSVQHGVGLAVDFRVTDFQTTLSVHYTGILPTLFREGQGVVMDGHLNKAGKFMATRVLAKHDENYMPPNIQRTVPAPVKGPLSVERTT